MKSSAALPAKRYDRCIGGTLVFGDGPHPTKLRVNVPIDRCMMITIHPKTGARNPALLRGVVEDFNSEIGVRCTADAIGTISVGEEVYLLPA
jgi:uncharacterized protein